MPEPAQWLRLRILQRSIRWKSRKVPVLEQLHGPLAWAANGALIAIPVVGIFFLLDVPQRIGWLAFNEQYMGLFLALALFATFLLIPVRAAAEPDRVPWYDLVAATAGLGVGLYVFIEYPALVNTLGEITQERVVLGTVTILLLAEATRRLVGLPLVIIAAVFVFYAFFAYLFPGDFYGRGWSVSRLATYLYLDANGIFGLPLQVGSSIVLVFILFGEVLNAIGGAAFLSDFAQAVMGRFRGGPAKIAIVSSSLFGNISGSAVANVVVDGAFTIPMMKKAGYPPPQAAAVEAVASTGGQIMPPVMGAAAFLIAEYLGIPYAQVALAALVPAILYYVTLFIQVDLLAARNGIHGLPRAELPHLLKVMRHCAGFVVPLIVLIVLMFFLNWRPEEAGLTATLAGLVVGLLTPGIRVGPREIFKILISMGRSMLEIAAITGLAGVVIGILQLTGLGFSLTLTLLNLGQSSAPLLLILTAIVSMILGMGMPTTAVYVLLAVLVAPGLSEVGYSSDRSTFIHLLLRYAEHDHAAGLYRQLRCGIHRQDGSDKNRLGGDAALRHCLCRPLFVCLFSFAVTDRALVHRVAFSYDRRRRRRPAQCWLGGLSVSSRWVSLNGFFLSLPQPVC